MMKRDTKKSSVGGGGIFRFIPRIYFSYILLAFLLLLLIHLLHNTSSPKSTHTPTVGFEILSHFKSGCLDIDSIEENLLNLDQADPQLIEYTRIKHLTPPSKLPYNLPAGENYKDVFNAWVLNFFKNKTNGVFIEAGAHEGGLNSHTLYLEKELGWTGLLIECNPTVVPILKTHHRKAWVADVCIAPGATPGMLNFSNPTNWTYSGTFKKPWNLPVPTKWTSFEVQTMPLYTVLAAINLTEIDYFSFDIESAELNVLKTIPFDLIKFNVLIIEVYFYSEAEKTELDTLLTSNGYQFVKNIQVDKIYIHKSVSYMLDKAT